MLAGTWPALPVITGAATYAALPGHPAAAGNGADARVLSKSAQYRRLLKMYGSGGTAGQEAPLVVDGVQSAAQQEAAQQGEQTQHAQQGAGGSGAANDGCQMCQYVVQYVKIALASNETIAQVRCAVAATAGCATAACDVNTCSGACAELKGLSATAAAAGQ